MLHTFLIICLALNGYYCRAIEIIHADYSEATTPIDCAMGGFIFWTQIDQQQEAEGFLNDGVRWHIKGVRCVQDNVVAGADLSERLKEHVK